MSNSLRNDGVDLLAGAMRQVFKDVVRSERQQAEQPDQELETEFPLQRSRPMGEQHQSLNPSA